MKIRLFFFLVIACIWSGCKSRSAFDYSQAIVKIESEFAADIVKADKDFMRLSNENQTDSAAIITAQMEAMAKSRLKQIKELKVPDVDEGENFKRAAIHYFTYLETVYTSLNKMTQATGEKEKEEERIKLSKIVADKDEATKTLQVAQQKFAAANNFRIEKVNSGD